MNNLVVSSSPHITSNRTVKGIMLDVVIALIPAMIASTLLYGFYSLFIIGISVGSCVLAEFLFNKIRKQRQTIGDCSAIVTGVILALNLPPTVPFYVPIFGGFFAIMLVKMLFGGIGKNFANPAITARIFLLLAWTGTMTTFVKPIDLSQGFGVMFENFKYTFGAFNADLENSLAAITGATPMAGIHEGNLTNVNVLDMFLGRTGGSLGETSALALLIGGVYLIVRKVIDWKIPTIYLATVAVLTLAIKQDIAFLLPSLFGGGLMLGAFFMATDYATSPNTKLGVCIYAFGLGLLTTLFRIYGSMPEGVSYAILLMNILVPLIDKIRPRPFGYVKPVKVKKEKATATAAPSPAPAPAPKVEEKKVEVKPVEVSAKTADVKPIEETPKVEETKPNEEAPKVEETKPIEEAPKTEEGKTEEPKVEDTPKSEETKPVEEIPNAEPKTDTKEGE